MFRNNLLRSCWKPGLSQDEVQHILAVWEKKLVESMHRWLHPEIWMGFRIWHHRTQPRAQVEAAWAKMYIRFVSPMFNRWRSHARIESLGPFLYARMLHMKLRAWRLETHFHRKAHLISLLVPFGRLRRRIDFLRGLQLYLRSLRHKGLRAAYNTWTQEAESRRGKELMAMQTIKSWQSGLRRAYNQWRGLRDAAVRMRYMVVRWRQYELYRLWRRWSLTFMKETHRARSAVLRWLESTLSRAFNTWGGASRRRARKLRLASRAAAAFCSRWVVRA